MKLILTSITWASKFTGQELQGPKRLVVDLEPATDIPLYAQIDQYLQERFLDNEDTALAVHSYVWEEVQ